MTAILNKIQKVLDGMDTQGVSHYLEEAFDGYVIFNKRMESGSELYKQLYQTVSDGTIELVGEPIKVKKKVDYVVIATNIKNMCEKCKEKAGLLIGNESTNFTEDDRDWLEALTEDKLDKLIPKIRTNKKTTIAEAWEMVTKSEDFINHVPDEVKVQINTAFRESEERQTLTTNIMTGSDWTEDELNGMSLSVLKKLETVKAGANFSANAAGVQKEVKVAPLPIPGVKLN
jgi:hypothetical protein